jgi:hypothetical protein
MWLAHRVSVMHVEPLFAAVDIGEMIQQDVGRM